MADSEIQNVLKSNQGKSCSWEFSYIQASFTQDFEDSTSIASMQLYKQALDLAI
jgi:hypothetical protein